MVKRREAVARNNIYKLNYQVEILLRKIFESLPSHNVRGFTCPTNRRSIATLAMVYLTFVKNMNADWRALVEMSSEK